MTAQVLSHLELVAAAGGGLRSLRRLLLSLALRGSFTQPVAEELAGQASGLGHLAELRAALAVKGRVSRLQQPAYNFGSVDRMPNGWPMVVASGIFLTRSGNSKLIKGQLLDQPAIHTYPGFSASGQDVWLETFEHEGEAVVVSAVGARCGKAFAATGRWSAIANTHVAWPVTELVSLEFAMLWLNDETFWLRAGGAQPFIKVSETLSRLIPLPPLAEQHRIVAKVDELMALCERLEVRQQDAEAAHARLVQALLDGLTQARDADEFQACWVQVADQLQSLFNTEGSILKLERAVLQWAASGRIRGTGNSAEMELSSVGKWAVGSGFPTAEQGKSGLPIKFCKVSDMNLPGNEQFIISTVHTISHETAKRLRVTAHPAGTVVFPKIGGAISTNKRRVLVEPTAIDNNCLGLIPNSSVSSDFLLLILKGIDFAKYQAGTSVPALSQGVIGRIRVRIPEIHHQRLVVEMVTELLALCDQLKARIAAARAKQVQIAATLVADALAA